MNFIGPLFTLIPVVGTYPLEYARTRLANNGFSHNNRQFTGYADVFKKTWDAEGIAGVYRGLSASLIRMMIHRTVYFGIYDSARYAHTDMGLNEQLLTAGFATITAGLLSFPLDTARRRIMMSSLEATKYDGLIDFCKKSRERGSPLKIYQGFSLYLLK